MGTQKCMYAGIELKFASTMQASYAMYCQLISIHFHFGYSFQTTSKDFIK